MIDFTDATGLFSAGLFIVALGLFVGIVSTWQSPWRIAALCSLSLAALLPIDGLSLAGYVRGVVGDLSITIVVVMLLGIGSRVFHRQGVPEKENIVLCGLVVLCGAIFYPMALGATVYDPYRMGYDSFYLPTALLLLGLAAWLKHRLLIVLCITLAMLAYSVGWYASTNLWDYLIDPILVAGSLFYLLRQAARSTMKKRHNRNWRGSQ
jgi:hypothetical protein